MAKIAASIRYDKEKLELAKKETGQPSLQKVFDYFLDRIWYSKNPPDWVKDFAPAITKKAELTLDNTFYGVPKPLRNYNQLLGAAMTAKSINECTDIVAEALELSLPSWQMSNIEKAAKERSRHPDLN